MNKFKVIEIHDFRCDITLNIKIIKKAIKTDQHVMDLVNEIFGRVNRGWNMNSDRECIGEVIVSNDRVDNN